MWTSITLSMLAIITAVLFLRIELRSRASQQSIYEHMGETAASLRRNRDEMQRDREERRVRAEAEEQLMVKASSLERG